MGTVLACNDPHAFGADQMLRIQGKGPIRCRFLPALGELLLHLAPFQFLLSLRFGLLQVVTSAGNHGPPSGENGVKKTLAGPDAKGRL